MPNQKLAEELHKAVIRTFKIRKALSSFIDNIWGNNLIDTLLISKFNKIIRSLFSLIDIQSKYTRVIPSKDEKVITITNAFQNKRSEFYNRSMKPWLEDNDTEMYSTHNEEKYVVAERFI